MSKTRSACEPVSDKYTESPRTATPSGARKEAGSSGGEAGAGKTADVAKPYTPEPASVVVFVVFVSGAHAALSVTESDEPV